MEGQERRALANKWLNDFLELSHEEVDYICNVLFHEPNWSTDQDSQSIRWLITAYLLIKGLPKVDSTLTKEQRTKVIRLCFAKIGTEFHDEEVKKNLFQIAELHCTQSEKDYINHVETLPQNDNGGAEVLQLASFK